MAHGVCDCHGGEVYRGMSHGYPAIIHNGNRVSRKLRLCHMGVEKLVAFAGQYLHDTALESYTKHDYGNTCDLKGEELGDSQAGFIYLTVYPTKQGRRDWHGLCCSQCLPDAMQELYLTS